MFETLILVAVLAQAAVPTNPMEVEFTSADHAVVTEYEAGFFLSGAAQPVTTVSLGKPALTSGKVHAQLPSRPSALGQYELKVRAKVGTVVSPWYAGGPLGDQPVPFVRALLPLANLAILR
jgi:hypothetical protein